MDDKAGQILDGYRLIRLLGRGGFGEVWLCRSQAMGDLRAIKLILASRPDKLEREYESLRNYRAVAGLLSPHLVPIEHINWFDGGLCYVMPLADGMGGDGPEDPGWTPLSLDFAIEAKRQEGGWFSSREVAGMLRPVLLALHTLSGAKLVHRDVKPANILFFDGRPRLGDVSLLGEDAAIVTRRGTPGYSAPSWYEGGHSDMYSAGATLYALLTGNPPDRMGRAAFLWPPQGEGSLSEAERGEWRRLHTVVRRASDERIQERYVDFAAMLAAVERRVDAEPSSGPAEEDGLAELTPEQKLDYRTLAGLAATYAQNQDYARAVWTVDDLLSKYPQARTQPVYSLYRAIGLKGLGRTDEAKEELRKPVHVSPQIALMSQRIDLWEGLGELKEAEASQTRILEAYGPNTLALLYRAEIRAKRGDYAGVEADREAALPLGVRLDSDPPDSQRRIVESMWGELERKYPGYVAHLVETGCRPTVAAASEEVPDDRWTAECLDDILDDLLFEDASLSDEENAALGKLRGYMGDGFSEGHHEYSLDMLDRLTVPQPGAGAFRAKTPVLSLYRSLLLDRLGRKEEAFREFGSHLHDDLSTRKAESRAALLVSLDRTSHAESLMGWMMDSLPSDGDSDAAMARIRLHGARARIRAIRADYPGVHEDLEEAARLAEELDSRSQSRGGSEGHNVRESVEQVRRSLEELFPACTAYLGERESGSVQASE